MDLETGLQLVIVLILIVVLWQRIKDFPGTSKTTKRESGQYRKKALTALRGNQATLTRLYNHKKSRMPNASDDAIYKEIYDDWVRDNR